MKFCVSNLHGSKVTEGDGPTDGRTDGRTDGPTDGPTDGRTKWIVEIPAGSKNHVKFFVFSTLKRVESCPKWV